MLEVEGKAYRVESALQVGEVICIDVYVRESGMQTLACRVCAWKCPRCGLVLKTLSLRQLDALARSHLRKHPELSP